MFPRQFSFDPYFSRGRSSLYGGYDEASQYHRGHRHHSCPCEEHNAHAANIGICDYCIEQRQLYAHAGDYAANAMQMGQCFDPSCMYSQGQGYGSSLGMMPQRGLGYGGQSAMMGGGMGYGMPFAGTRSRQPARGMMGWPNRTFGFNPLSRLSGQRNRIGWN